MNKVRSYVEVELGTPIVLSGSIRIVLLGLATCGAIVAIALKPAMWVYVVPITGIVLTIALSMERNVRKRMKMERRPVHPDDDSAGGVRRCFPHDKAIWTDRERAECFQIRNSTRLWAMSRALDC